MTDGSIPKKEAEKRKEEFEDKLGEIDEEIEELKNKFKGGAKNCYRQIMNSASIVCTTCINSHKVIDKDFWSLKKEHHNIKDCPVTLDCRVIIDEAAQAKEPEILVPLLGAE